MGYPNHVVHFTVFAVEVAFSTLLRIRVFKWIQFRGIMLFQRNYNQHIVPFLFRM